MPKAKEPRLFGGAARTRLLITLATGAPRGLRALSNDAGMDHSFVYPLLSALVRIGLARREGSKPLYGFDQSHALSEEIADVLCAFGNHTRMTHDTMYRRVLDGDWRDIFGHRPRGDVLLALHRSGPSTLRDLTKLTALDSDALRGPTEFLKRAGIVKIKTVSHRRVIMLDEKTVGYEDLRTLLRKIIFLTSAQT